MKSNNVTLGVASTSIFMVCLSFVVTYLLGGVVEVQQLPEEVRRSAHFILGLATANQITAGVSYGSDFLDILFSEETLLDPPDEEDTPKKTLTERFKKEPPTYWRFVGLAIGIIGATSAFAAQLMWTTINMRGVLAAVHPL